MTPNPLPEEVQKLVEQLREDAKAYCGILCEQAADVLEQAYRETRILRGALEQAITALEPIYIASKRAGDEWVNEIPLKLDHDGLPEINFTLGDLRVAQFAFSKLVETRKALAAKDDGGRHG